MRKKTTPESRRMAVRQALANTRIEGHIPTPQFMADVDALVQGKLTADQMVARSLERARSMPPDGNDSEGEAVGRDRFR